MTNNTQELDEFMHNLGFRYQNSEGGYYIHHHVRNEKNPSSLNSVLIPYVAEQILDWHNKQIAKSRLNEAQILYEDAINSTSHGHITYARKRVERHLETLKEHKAEL